MLMHYIGVLHLKRTRQSSRETKARSPSQHSIEVADELHLVVVVTHLVHCGIVLKSSFEILHFTLEKSGFILYVNSKCKLFLNTQVSQPQPLK